MCAAIDGKELTSVFNNLLLSGGHVRVRTIRIEHERVEYAHVTRHLLHPAKLPLLLGVSELDHEA